MDTLRTEEQQIDAIKQWWKENGSSIVTGVVLGLAVLFGGKAWFAYQERNAQSASNIYAFMMNALQSGDTLNAGEKAGMLLADYGNTPYASLGALALARTRLEEGQLDAARAQLQWVLDNSDNEVFRDIAGLRLVQKNRSRMARSLSSMQPKWATWALLAPTMLWVGSTPAHAAR